MEEIEWLACRDAITLSQARYLSQDMVGRFKAHVWALIHYAGEGMIASRADFLEIARPEEFGGPFGWTDIEYSPMTQSGDLLRDYLKVAGLAMDGHPLPTHSLSRFDQHLGFLAFNVSGEGHEEVYTVRIGGLQFGKRCIEEQFGADAGEPKARTRTRGRPKGTGGHAASDAPLVEKMRALILSDSAVTAAQAAWQFAPEAAGSSLERKQRRLRDRYREKFGN